MKIAILCVLGILSVLYGILIFQVGLGTSFWLVWEAIGLFFLLWAFLVHKDFFTAHGMIKIIFRTFVVAAIVVLAILCAMIAGGFAAKGSENLDYVIVLGAQVREDRPSVVLRYRLDAAIDYLNENPDTICIVSGGQGRNESFPEAEVMAEYLLEKGIEKSRILLEDQSKNTAENIRNSKSLIEQSHHGVGIVTNNFHVFRAVQIAKAQGLEGVCGVAADSTVLYLPNNVLRECCGILKDWLVNNI